ncbi:protein DMP2-like [Vigna radiata var. radiata]|uniref:Protein DMP2-like n=1 Tax=Vigna radiata var. radiata TaxID=3916 RepID=A0A3Q0FF73_VIGRR|nr:protein DMP2-like [Vigna radiata var. radiata]
MSLLLQPYNNTMSEKGNVTASTMSGKTCSALGNLVKLLPTGTVFFLQFLIPVVTNNGHCTTFNKYLTGALLVVCAFSCAFSSFTDSYTGTDGQRHFGIVTAKGLSPSPASESLDLSVYKLRFGDFVHAFFSLVVFAVLGLLDTNSVRCFYPEFESGEKVLMEVLPPVIGVVASSVFVIFPNKRHGIGYPTTSDSNDTSQKSKTSSSSSA